MQTSSWKFRLFCTETAQLQLGCWPSRPLTRSHSPPSFPLPLVPAIASTAEKTSRNSSRQLKKTCHWNVNYLREKGRRTFKKNINQLKKLTLHNIRCHVKVRLPWLHRSQGQDNTLQQPSARQQVIVQLVQGTITFSQGLGSFFVFVVFCSTHIPHTKHPWFTVTQRTWFHPIAPMNSIESPSKNLNSAISKAVEIKS